MTSAKTPHYWEDAKKYLSGKDKVMGRIIRQYKGETLRCRGNAFHTLARSIVGQQISVKAADSIWKKLEQGIVKVRPEQVLAAEDTALRACGLSGQKVVYLRTLAEHFAGRKRMNWHKKTDAEVLKELVALKGIGQWTVEMFMIFHLMREDVFPLADIGVQKAIERSYNNGKKMTRAQFIKIGEQWKPWRTVATWYLWRSLDPVPVEY